jgi:hypothetical protein
MACRDGLTIRVGACSGNDSKSMHRSFVPGKGRRHWVFAYLFAKRERASIDDDELAYLEKPAQGYDHMTDDELASAPRHGDFLELCDEK